MIRACTAERKTHLDAPAHLVVELLSLPFTHQPLPVYAGRITILVRFKQSMIASAPLRIRLSCQPCNSDACFPALTKELEVPLPRS